MAQFMMIASAATQFIGAIYQGEAEAKNANAAGDLATMNARNARLQSNAREETQRRHNTMALGNLRAASAETGFDASTGSLASLQTKSAGQMELDALTTRYEGELQSISFENEANAYRAKAKNARKSGVLNAFGSLASSGASYMTGGAGGGMGAK